MKDKIKVGDLLKRTYGHPNLKKDSIVIVSEVIEGGKIIHVYGYKKIKFSPKFFDKIPATNLHKLLYLP